MNHAAPITRRSFIAASALALGACGRAGAPETVQSSFFCFDTACVVGGTLSRPALDAAVERCQRFERLFSRTLEQSDVGRVNAAAGGWTEVDPATAELVSLALGYCEASDGLFDITVGALTRLWDFHAGVVPSADDIASALPHVDWTGVEVRGSRVRLRDPLAALDLGGIAKGYVADHILADLGEGAGSAFVNLGGNVAVHGPKADGSAWRLGVRDPFSERASDVVATVESVGGSLVTSGLYERSFERDGRRYWHILDPRTGYPVETGVVSASVYAARSLDGDGYTKRLFFGEPDAGLAWAEGRGVECLLVLDDGTRLASEGFA